MKRWALGIIGMYAVLLAALLWPACKLSLGINEPIFEIYPAGFVGLWFGVMVLSEALLLLVPLGTAERRPKRGGNC